MCVCFFKIKCGVAFFELSSNLQGRSNPDRIRFCCGSFKKSTAEKTFEGNFLQSEIQKPFAFTFVVEILKIYQWLKDIAKIDDGGKTFEGNLETLRIHFCCGSFNKYIDG